MSSKELLRAAWQQKLASNPEKSQWGKVAEKLRSLKAYREADTVFAAPGPSLVQARINSLADGKNLVMPAPSLRLGFFFLPARAIPFKDLAAAVAYKGLEKYGQRVKHADIDALRIGLLLTGSVVIDARGNRLGDGKGFFDLCGGLLYELGGLREDFKVYTLVREEQIFSELLPHDPWDIPMSGAVTPSGILTFDPPIQKPTIIWEALTQDRIRRIDPLWKLYQAKGAGY